MEHEFGGSWTEKKLEILDRYLKTYRRIFDVNAGARSFETWYVDAFAGIGERTQAPVSGAPDLFAELEQPEVTRFQRGSAQIALDLRPGFDRHPSSSAGATSPATWRSGSETARTSKYAEVFFAAANPRGARPAVKIARHLLEKF